MCSPTLSDEGHVFVPRPRLLSAAAEILTIDPPIIEKAIGDLAAEERIVIEPLPAGDEAVYLKSLHTAEAASAGRIRLLLGTEVRPIRIDIERAIAWFEEQQNIALADEQKEAIRKAATSKLLVVTGGPGTGKTTLVNGIIRILEKKGRRILLAAPTGRAAKRMAETTGREAKTIHRLLEFNPKKFGFDRDASNPLEADLVILDEASMIDTVLAYNVLKALPLHCQLVLVGDIDQLPSVGPGSVLGDIIRSGVADVVRLRHIFRQGSREPHRRQRPPRERGAHARAAPRGLEGRLLLHRAQGARGDCRDAQAPCQGPHPSQVRARSRGRHPGAHAHAAGPARRGERQRRATGAPEPHWRRGGAREPDASVSATRSCRSATTTTSTCSTATSAASARSIPSSRRSRSSSTAGR